jgi:hypothetical protein
MELHQVRYFLAVASTRTSSCARAQRRSSSTSCGVEINAAMVGDVQDIPARIDDWSLLEERSVVVLAATHQLANPPSIGIDDLRETVLLERAG